MALWDSAVVMVTPITRQKDLSCADAHGTRELTALTESLDWSWRIPPLSLAKYTAVAVEKAGRYRNTEIPLIFLDTHYKSP